MPGAPRGAGWRSCSALRGLRVTGGREVLLAGLITRAEVAVLIHKVRGVVAVVLLADDVEDAAGLGGGNAVLRGRAQGLDPRLQELAADGLCAALGERPCGHSLLEEKMPRSMYMNG
ncbi:hypothetical protein [Prosthecobacter sp.]|uniref:hypothetical protein n=1 Tax=Prosthecobacter sp. TaxID=1965333 RepID=UPI002487C1F0|nr:hypothetical protein [Prosthecobacter sp.]MDI1314805.1 hypothetical protein [Prosthecobacter sp.]